MSAQENVEDLHFAMLALAMINIDAEWVWCKVVQADELRMGRLQPSTKASSARTAVSPVMLPYSSVVGIQRDETMVYFVWSPKRGIEVSD